MLSVESVCLNRVTQHISPSSLKPPNPATVENQLKGNGAVHFGGLDDGAVCLHLFLLKSMSSVLHTKLRHRTVELLLLTLFSVIQPIMITDHRKDSDQYFGWFVFFLCR